MPLRLRKRGKYYQVRGSVPIRTEEGVISRTRIEESTRCTKRADAEKVAAAIERQYFESAYHPVPKGLILFSDAALMYIQTTGNQRYIEPLTLFFQYVNLTDIDQDAALRACDHLYPGCAPSTLNRQVFTPLIAIKRLAAESGLDSGPALKRPKGHDSLPELELPSDDWFDAVLPHCNPRTAALIITLSITGRRISELVGIKSKSVNADGNAQVGRTKNGEPILIRIPEEAFQVIDAWEERERFFGYATRYGANQAIERACERAGVPYYSSHAIGRHSFATRVLREGHSLKFLTAAGGWKSIAMPAKRYGHLERSEVEETVQKLGQKWVSKRARPAKVDAK